MSALFHLLFSVGCLAIAQAQVDFGMEVQTALQSRAEELFGHGYLKSPADESDYVPREQSTAMQRVKLAPGLKAEFLARNVGYKADMIAFYPNENEYSHLIVCNEDSRSDTGNNPGVQAINAETGEVKTIVFGMDRCDGIRTTPWGTILATEETYDGAAYEIFMPLSTADQWIADRTAGTVVTAINGTEPSKTIFKRPALPIMAWEGLTIMKSGVLYGGDELRPGSGTLDKDGGAIFKFVPEVAFMGGDVTPETSPFVSGRVYAMQVSCYESDSDDFPQYGQGCEIGQAAWVEIDPKYARNSANSRGATGYYRPEDLHSDPAYVGKGIRWCVANTGRSDGNNPGEVICVVDENPLGDGTWYDERSGYGYQSADGMAPYAVNVTRFIEGGTRFNSLDNLAFNPKTGYLYVVEDALYGEVYACLPDGKDDDFRSDGCIPMLSVTDPEAEPSGFEFDGTGKVAYVHIQHGECPDELKDFTSNPDTGCTDDLLKITGFKLPKGF